MSPQTGQDRCRAAHIASLALAATIVALIAQAALPTAAAGGLPPLGCIQPPAWVGPQTAPPKTDRPPEVLSWRHQILADVARGLTGSSNVLCQRLCLLTHTSDQGTVMLQQNKI